MTPASLLLNDGSELILLPKSQLSLSPNLHAGMPRVAWDDAESSSCSPDRPPDRPPNEPTLYRCKIVSAAKIGASYTLTAQDSSKTNFFLKLPGLDVVSAPRTADQLARHFDQEFDTLRELRDVRGSGIHRIGSVSEILATADFYPASRNGGPSDLGQMFRYPALIELHVQGLSLTDWCRDEKVFPFIRTCPVDTVQTLWFLISFALSMALRRVHNRGIVHASIRPEHVMLGDEWNKLAGEEGLPDFSESRIQILLSQVFLVGWGTSSLLFDASYIKALEATFKKNSFIAPELRKSKRRHGLYSYPVDIYSLGATMQYLLETIGQIKTARIVENGLEEPKIEEVRNKTGDVEAFAQGDSFPAQVEELKQTIARRTLEAMRGKKLELAGRGSQSVKKEQPQPFSQWENIARVVDKALRHSPADRYLCSEEMISFILNAASATDRKRMTQALAMSEGFGPEIDGLIERHAKPGGIEPTPLREFVGSKLREQISMLLRSLSRSDNECWGSRDVIIDHLSSFVGTLREGDEYCTVTLPGYWTNNNLGTNGRFLVLNKHLARRNVRIRRVFLVAESFDQLPFQEQEVLLAQQEAINALAEEMKDHNFDVRVYEVSNEPQEFRLNEHQRRVVAFTKKTSGKKNEGPDSSSSQYTGISFLSHGEEYHDFGTLHLKLTITKVRLKALTKPQADHDERNFELYWNDSKPLHSYIGGGIPLKEVLASGAKATDSLRKSKSNPIFSNF